MFFLLFLALPNTQQRSYANYCVNAYICSQLIH